MGEPSERLPDAAEQQDIEMTGTDGQGTMPPQYPDPLVVTGAPLAKNGSVVPATDGSSELAKDGSEAGVGEGIASTLTAPTLDLGDLELGYLEFGA